MTLLDNGDFEKDWSEESSHDCLLVPPTGPLDRKEVGNIFTPPGWLTWFSLEFTVAQRDYSSASKICSISIKTCFNDGCSEASGISSRPVCL